MAKHEKQKECLTLKQSANLTFIEKAFIESVISTKAMVSLNKGQYLENKKKQRNVQIKQNKIIARVILLLSVRLVLLLRHGSTRRGFLKGRKANSFKLRLKVSLLDWQFSHRTEGPHLSLPLPLFLSLSRSLSPPTTKGGEKEDNL